MEPNAQEMEFLEAAVKDLFEQEKPPKKIVLAWLDDENDVTFSYHNLSYADLQKIGQELINEGTLRLVATSKDRIAEFEEEEDG